MLFRDAEVDGVRRDVEIAGDDEVVDCRGGALLPGLHDHHIHLFALAARAASITCGPPGVTDAPSLRRVLAAATPVDGWIRGVGYHASVAGDLDRESLDALRADAPTRVQERAGALWVLNSAAVHAVGLDPATHDGRFFRADDWLRSRTPPTPLDFSAVGAELARFGVTGVTEATPDLDAAALALLAGAGLPQRLHLLSPGKILLPDHALPAYDDLRDAVRDVHATGRTVAIHCVTAESAALVLSVFDEVGAIAGDRLEHGSVLPEWTLPRIADLGLAIVTQPAFVLDRGDDYLHDVDPVDLGDLYRHASLLTAGIRVAVSSDAPFGPLDPWQVIAAARDRATRSGAVVGPAERVSAVTALAGLLSPPNDPGGPARRVTAESTDVVLLDVPLAVALAEPSADHVRRTVCAGRTVYVSQREGP